MTALLGQISLETAAISDRVRSLFDQADLSGTVALKSAIVKHGPAGSIALKGEPRFDGRSGPTELTDLLLSAWRTEGSGMLARVHGPFALVMVDAARRRVMLAIDRMGIEKLTYGITDELFAFGTSASDVARILFPQPQLNPQAIFDFMLCHMVPAPDTAFSEVCKLLPGTAVEFSGSDLQCTRYWQPDFRRSGTPRISELQESLLPTMRHAVQLTEPGEGTGSFLSGGLDSSTVTGLLAEARPDSLAFSIGFGVPEFNELKYARIAAEHFGTRHHEYEVTAEDVLRIVPEIAAACDEPFGNSSIVPTLSCIDLAASHGITHVLAGDGGDELFGGNERYVTQRLFEHYSRIPRFFRRHVLDPLATFFHPEDSLLPLRKFASYVQQAKIPLPERYESWNLAYREGTRNIFGFDFLNQVDPRYPLTRMYETWASCPSEDLLDQMLWYDWKFTLADNDLRKVKQMCDLRGMRVSFPMLDEKVVDLSLQVPSDAKIEGRNLRAFYKRATRDLLPPEIIRKTKHGFGLPFGHWLKTHQGLQDLAYGSLETLEKRNIFQPDFLRKVANEHRQGHPGYYGYAIWDLMTLEQWLQAREGANASGKTPDLRSLS